MSSLNKRFPLYAKLLRLYPAPYRREYEQQILQTTADMLDNPEQSGGRALTWTKISLDLPLNIAKQQVHYVGGIYMKETPSYVKISGILSGLLLLPFFAALIANGLDKVINNQTLYNSWVWRTDFLRLWVLILPLIAASIALVSFLVYVFQGSTNKPKNLLGRSTDLKHNWPIVMTGLAALGILFILRFHDSIPCWIQMHTHLLHHKNLNQACQNY